MHPGARSPDRTLTSILALTFATTAVTSAWVSVAHVQRSHAIGSVVAGKRLTSASASTLDDRVLFATLVYGLLALSLLVLFIIWTYQAATIVRWRRPDALRRAPGWAIGGWFVPLANFVLPKQMVDDIWDGAVPPGKPRQTPGWAHAWWAAFVSGSLLRTVGSGFTQADGVSPDTIASGDLIIGVAYAILAVAALLGAAMVLKTRARFSRPEVSADELGPDPWPASRLAKAGIVPAVLALVVAVFAGVTAPAVGTQAAGQQRSAGTGGTSQTPQSTPEPVHSLHGAWKQLLVAAPHGWASSGHDVRISLPRLSREFAKPGLMRRDLTTFGYRRGVNREYYQPSPRKVVDVELWQFATAQGAGDFFDAWLTGNAPATNKAWSKRFAVHAGHQAHGLVGHGTDRYGFHFDVAAAGVGDIVIHVRFAELGTPPVSEIDQLMKRSVAQLVRGAARES
jgi:hypothetical protein